MKRFLASCCLLAWAGCALLKEEASCSLRAPVDLTAEYLRAPVGIDCPAPRLSWKLVARQAAARNLRQTAYRVVVASSPDKLARFEGDLWDSGRVASEQSLNVVYGGVPLKSSQRCYWAVRAWDNAGFPSPWSAPQRWVMGVMRPDDWRAKWIGAHATTRPDCDLMGAKWIWTGDAPSLGQAAAGKRYYRKVFEAPPGVAEAPVMLAITGDDEWDLYLNGSLAAKTWGHFNDWRWLRFIDVGKYVREGKNVVTVCVANKDPGPTGLLAMLKFANGSAVVTDSSWQTCSQAPKDLKEANSNSLISEGWRNAMVAGAADAQPWGKLERRLETVSPAFEKRFNVTKAIREATLHITGLGFYEARLNGSRIGNKVLDPSPTKFDRRVLYSTYDLTDSVSAGENKLEVLLGHGWYDVRSVAVWNFDNAPWRDFPRLIAQLELLYEDGTRETVCSDGTWRQKASPLGFDCIREGEVIGIQPPGAPDLEKTTVFAEAVPAPAGRLAAAAMPPAVVAQKLPPKSVRALKPGVWLVDFGQNMAGWIRLKIRGQQAGDVITVRYGEKLLPDGGLSLQGTDAHFRYPASFRVLPGGWFQTDRIVCDGGPQEYEPRFTYNGFQYVEISGLKSAPTEATVEACVVHTAFSQAGSFACDNELVNKLQQAILWAYRSNFVDGYPTDCPHREKNGWTGDAQLACEQAMYNFQNTAAYEKWVRDLMDEQRPDGNLPGIVPTSGWGYVWGNGPAWDSALLIVPWTLYVYQGDVRILEQAYPAMCRYVDYMTSRSKDGIVSHGLGDWVPVKTKTPAEVTSTGYYYLGAQIVARTAELLGKEADAKKYSALSKTIREAFDRAFYKGGGTYSIGSQTAQSVALHQGLASLQERARVAARLAEVVEQNGAFPDFGILGSKYVFRSLSDAGRSDLAFAVATQDSKPSYGSWIRRGATTFWEDWNEGSSRNHIMFGDVSAWFYQYLGGIRLAPDVSAVAQKANGESVGFKTFVIRPDPVEGLGWVQAEHHSPYGKIRSCWKKAGPAFTLEVDVPVNTAATVYLPVSPRAKNVVSDVQALPEEGDRMAFRVGSGHYTFRIR